ncbi:MAG: hypothetical protein LAT57_01940 [Balneolales bacterium]|nr:hypothetical protein [Balneolales bacterium]
MKSKGMQMSGGYSINDDTSIERPVNNSCAGQRWQFILTRALALGLMLAIFYACGTGNRLHDNEHDDEVNETSAGQSENPGPLLRMENGQLTLIADKNGDRIPDFSWVGYHHSSRPLPEVPTVKVLEPLEGDADDTERIQAAIDAVSARPLNENGHRGALLLKAGVYRVYGQLSIRQSGVVLRGEGQHQQGTVIIAMGTDRRSLIDIRGTAGMTEIHGTRTAVTDARIPVGTHRIPVQDASVFLPGDDIIVHRAANDHWVEELGMHLFEYPNVPWDPERYSFNWNRKVVAVDDNTIIIDAPTVHAIEEQFGGGWVARADGSGRIQEVGIEQLRLVSDFDYHPYERTDPDHSRNAIVMDNVVNSWVRNITGVHFAFATVFLRTEAQQVTVLDAANLDMVSPIAGSQRYPFLINGHQNLIMRCYSETGRHDFVLQAHTPGPNSLVDCRSEEALSVSEPHHRYSHGVLFDNIEVYGPAAGLWAMNRGDSGTGHGWSGAWTVIWNSGAKVMGAMDPPFARNLVVGYRPTEVDERSLQNRSNWIQNRSGLQLNRIDGTNILYLHRHSIVHPEGMVEPRSLFIEQLRQRLGDEAVEAITTPAQRSGDLEAIAAELNKMREIDGPEVIAREHSGSAKRSYLSTDSEISVSNSSWQADPEVILEREASRPAFRWRESQVPEYELPDALKMTNGATVQNVDQWSEQRQALMELLRTEMYGQRPGPPEQLNFRTQIEDENAMKGNATMRVVTVESEHNGREHDFEVVLFLPNNSEAPVPMFLLLNNRAYDNTDPTRDTKSDFWPAEEVIGRGYGIAAIQNRSLAPDDTAGFTEGVIRLFEGDAISQRSPDAWGAVAAWGWGASRVMDYFELADEIDHTRVAVLGHSRGGKASLWAGAEDERFALVISNNSGSGGAALSRRMYGEDIRALNRFTHWFNDNFKKYSENEVGMPFDQHFLISLIAPRAVYVGSADQDLWADPKGEFLGLAHASPVYKLYNYDVVDTNQMPPLDTPVSFGPRGYHVRSGIHNLTLQDWTYYMDFADTLWSD